MMKITLLQFRLTTNIKEKQNDLLRTKIQLFWLTSLQSCYFKSLVDIKKDILLDLGRNTFFLCVLCSGRLSFLQSCVDILYFITTCFTLLRDGMCVSDDDNDDVCSS